MATCQWFNLYFFSEFIASKLSLIWCFFVNICHKFYFAVHKYSVHFNSKCYGSHTLHRTRNETGTGTGIGTIENNGSLSLSLCRNPFRNPSFPVPGPVQCEQAISLVLLNPTPSLHQNPPSCAVSNYRP